VYYFLTQLRDAGYRDFTLQRFFGSARQWGAQFYPDTLAGRADVFAVSADLGQARFDVCPAVAGGDAAGELDSTGVSASLSVIGDDDAQVVAFKLDVQLHFAGAGMADGIVQCFFQGEKQIVADVRAHGAVGEFNGHLQAAANRRGCQILVGETGEIVEQTFQRVMLRVHGPNDFVHTAGHFAGADVDLREVVGSAVGVVGIFAGGLAQHPDAREAGSEVVVDVLGDAGAFALDLAFAVGVLQLAPSAGALNGNDAAAEDDEAGNRRTKFEPPRFPEMRLHMDDQRGGGAAPNAVVIAGLQLENIFARGQITEGDRAAGVGFGPPVIEAFKQPFETDLFRGGKTQCRELDFNLLSARRNLDAVFYLTGPRHRQEEFAADVNRFDDYRRWLMVGIYLIGIDHGEAARIGKPQPPVCIAKSRWSKASGACKVGQPLGSAIGQAVELLLSQIVGHPVQVRFARRKNAMG